MRGGEEWGEPKLRDTALLGTLWQKLALNKKFFDFSPLHQSFWSKKDSWKFKMMKDFFISFSVLTTKLTTVGKFKILTRGQ